MKGGTGASSEALSGGMADELYARLIHEIEIERGRMNTHEAVCSERYGSLQEKLGDLKTGMAAIQKAVSGQGGKMNRWAIASLVAVMGVMLSIIAWEAGQLYQMQPLRPPIVHTS